MAPDSPEHGDPMKAISKSVSMPAALWAVLEQFAKDQGGDRSSWLRGVAVPALEAAGVWPIEGMATVDTLHAVRLKRLEALHALGVDVDQGLERMLQEAGQTPVPAH